MARTLVAALLALGTLGLTARAEAQANGFGSERPFILSLEHLAGVTYTKMMPEESGLVGDEEDSEMIQAGTFVGFPSFGTLLVPPSSQARIGLHYFVSPNVSLGALLSYADNDQLGTRLIVGGRVGVAMPLGETSSIWIRGGFLYAQNAIDSSGGEFTTSAMVPGGELLFVFEPVEHFGVMLGPMFEYGFGKEKAEGGGDSSEADFTYFETGLTVGFFTAW